MKTILEFIANKKPAKGDKTYKIYTTKSEDVDEPIQCIKIDKSDWELLLQDNDYIKNNLTSSRKKYIEMGLKHFNEILLSPYHNNLKNFDTVLWHLIDKNTKETDTEITLNDFGLQFWKDQNYFWCIP